MTEKKQKKGILAEYFPMVQRYYFVPLDIFKKNMDNKPIENELEAWLAFLSFDDPERILQLIQYHPRFKAMYQDIYEICRNMEEVMSVYSKELEEMDRNTVKYMMDEMQEKLDQAEERAEQFKREREQEKKLAEERVQQLSAEIQRLREELEQMRMSK